MDPDDPSSQDATREHAYDPIVRWKHIQERIAWAERNIVHRQTAAACVREQQRLWESGVKAPTPSKAKAEPTSR